MKYHTDCSWLLLRTEGPILTSKLALLSTVMKNYRQFQRHKAIPSLQRKKFYIELVCGCSSVTCHLNVTTLAKYHSTELAKTICYNKLLAVDGAVGSRRSK